MFADSPDITIARALVAGISTDRGARRRRDHAGRSRLRPGSRRRSHAAGKPRGNAVTHWNAVATDAFTPSQGTNPMAQSRTLAILHAAIHDALNAIDRRFESYTPGLAEAPGASVDAAVAAAARDVLVGLAARPGGAGGSGV